jgi:hypothetical protein
MKAAAVDAAPMPFSERAANVATAAKANNAFFIFKIL